jgi:transposase
MAWRANDSLMLRRFLRIGLEEAGPDHSTISRTRRRIDVETHREVFVWVLRRVAESGLLKGQTVGIDATTLEANAALRSIVRRDTGEGYQEFLQRLAKESGIATPTREELARLDRKRPHKGSNQDWEHPYDRDARITKMKDGRTHLAHKAEHAVDMESGAVVAVAIQPADRGDPDTVKATLAEAREAITAVAVETPGPEAGEPVKPPRPAAAVLDKGYHSNEALVDLKQDGVRSYCSEPERGRRSWKGKRAEQAAVYAKERRLVEEIKTSLERGRKVQVYAVYTQKRDVTRRLESILAKEGIRVAVLTTQVAPEEREAWYERQLRTGVQVVVGHPRLTQTGLDLLSFQDQYCPNV